MRSHWERLRQGGRIDSWESQRISKDGRTLEVLITATVLKDDSGRPVAIAKTARDMTERKRLEREVVESASLEQRRIGQELHDSVGQELTALSMLAGDLAQTLRTDPASAVRASRADGAGIATQSTRAADGHAGAASRRGG